MQNGPEQKAARKAAFDAFRHEQTVKRWLNHNTKKPSKVVYLSDFLEHGVGAAALASCHTVEKGVPHRRRRQKVLVPGTLYHTQHQSTRRGARETAQGVEPPRNPSQRGNKPTKQRDPLSEVPYNHRQKWTRLKRTIFDTRQRVFESQRAAHTEPNTAETAPNTGEWQRAQGMVHQLELLYTSLDVAMHHHQRRLAAVLTHRIRQKRLQLRRQVSRALADDREPSCESVLVARAPVSRPVEGTAAAVYSNFYPSTTALHVGQHPHRTAVDHRTGRYPHALATDAVQSLARALADDAMSAPTTSTPPRLAPSVAATPAVTPASNRLFLGAYCRNTLDDTMDDLLFTLLQSLYVEQREVRQKQPLQFKARQRYVVGLQETIKFLRAGRVKLVLLAGDMEVTGMDAPKSSTAPDDKTPQKRKFQSLDEAVVMLHALCGLDEQDQSSVSASSAAPAPHPRIPCVCCMTRQRLSYALFAKGSKIACVGILHSDKHPQLLRAAIGYSQRSLVAYDQLVAAI